MSASADLLAAGINPAEGEAKGGWTPPLPEALVGIFPHLDIIALVGRGGMGAVYKARQTHLDRLVAVKLLSAERGADPAFVDRFTREAQALARLQHPHIVTLFDFGRAGTWLYLVMEYVDGANLRQLLATGKLSPTETLRLVAPLCEAMFHAHAQGVVHRDLKPENILIDGQGQPKIADFGLAKLRSSIKGDLTQSGHALGTLHYMAPEQVSGAAHVDHRADVYALGVVFYEMLTGNLPLGRCLPPSESGADPRLDEVVLKSLEREPDKRWQSVEELRKAMAGVQNSPATSPLANAAGANSAPLSWKVKAVIAAALVWTLAVFVLACSGTLAQWSTPAQERTAAVPPPLMPASSDATQSGRERLEQMAEEARKRKAELGAMESHQAELERRLAELASQAAQAEARAAAAQTAVAQAEKAQAEKAQAEKAQVSPTAVPSMTAEPAVSAQTATPAAVPTPPTPPPEAEHNQEAADALAQDLAARIPAAPPTEPIRLELHLDRAAMTTIGHIVYADGTGEDLPPEPWPKEGAKVLVSKAKATVERRYADVVQNHQHLVAQRRELVHELVARSDELQRLDLAGKHTALIARLHALEGAQP